MDEIKSDSRSDAPGPSAGSGQGDSSAEMRRQMEAAKLRMQKSQAVYGRPVSPPETPVSRPEEA